MKLGPLLSVVLVLMLGASPTTASAYVEQPTPRAITIDGNCSGRRLQQWLRVALGPKTRVRVFSLSRQLCVGDEGTLSPEARWGFRPKYDGSASETTEDADRLIGVRAPDATATFYDVGGDGSRLGEKKVPGYSGALNASYASIPGATSQLRYGFDATGGLQQITDALNGNATVASFVTNAAGRVTQETRGTQFTRNYGWDADGRLTSIGVIQGANPAVISRYGYDAQGWRRTKSGPTNVNYLWGATDVLEERPQTGGAILYALGAGGEPVGLGADRALHDALGGVTGHDSGAGASTLYRSDAWGNYVTDLSNPTHWTQPPASGPSAGYAGGYSDPDVGLKLHGQRWFNSVTGTWVSEDPIGPGGRLETPMGINPWLYADGNPLRYTDPLGLDPSCFNGEDQSTCEARLRATGRVNGSIFQPTISKHYVHPLERQSQQAIAEVERNARVGALAVGVGLTLASGGTAATLLAGGTIGPEAAFVGLTLSGGASGASFDYGTTGRVSPTGVLIGAVTGPLALSPGAVAGARAAFSEYAALTAASQLSEATVAKYAAEAALEKATASSAGPALASTTQATQNRTITLYGFRGAGSTADLLADGAPGPYVVTGHVGYSFNGGQEIYGFGPSIPKGMSPYEVVQSLKNGDLYPGVITKDTYVFELVANSPRIGRGGIQQTVYQQQITVSQAQFDAIKAAHDSIGLDNPMGRVFYGFPPKGGTVPADCVFNCATFPRSLGIPIPEGTGTLKTYIPKLEQVGVPWTPAK